MSKGLDDLVPSILSMIDDHDTENVRQGLDQLLNCLDNFSRLELEKRNWSLVIYDALHKAIHDKDSQVIQKLGTALLKALLLVEEDPNEFCDKLTRYDATLKKILFTMELSSDMQQKKDWLPYLALFVEKMGHATLHWVDRINSMLSDYAANSCDPQYLILILKVIETLVKNTWSKASSREWIQIILKILFNQGVFSVTGGGKLDNSDVYECIKKCFELMSKCEDFSECKIDLNETLQRMRANSCDNLYQQMFLVELDKCDLAEFL